MLRPRPEGNMKFGYFRDFGCGPRRKLRPNGPWKPSPGFTRGLLWETHIIASAMKGQQNPGASHSPIFLQGGVR
jgi:hypothetical protein